jgi:hypothetical protein
MISRDLFVEKKMEEHALFDRRNNSYIDENNFGVVLLFCILNLQHNVQEVVDVRRERKG